MCDLKIFLRFLLIIDFMYLQLVNLAIYTYCFHKLKLCQRRKNVADSLVTASSGSTGLWENGGRGPSLFLLLLKQGLVERLNYSTNSPAPMLTSGLPLKCTCRLKDAKLCIHSGAGLIQRNGHLFDCCCHSPSSQLHCYASNRR